MERDITRRDFLNGVGVTITGSLASLSPLSVFGLEGEGSPYPPALTGLRGSHDGSWEVAHEMREGKSWNALDSGENYDLVVVGGGVSGLSAAYFFRKEAGAGARILVLDNHDDFGGHAKRNEFESGKRLLIGYGGSQSIDTPSGFSAESVGLLRELGVDLDRFHTAFDADLYRGLGLGRAEFFDRETFGADLLVRRGEMSWKEFAASIPLPDAARRDLIRLHEDVTTDYMSGLSVREKLARLNEISYLAYLRDHVKVDPKVLTYLYRRSNGLFGIGIDGVPALRAFRLEYPGFEGLGRERGLAGRMGGEAKPGTKEDPYIFHFPDGNASIPRLLVRSLVPAAASGSSMEDVVTARFDYGKLDGAASNVRIRLGSTVVRIRHEGSPSSAKEVEVTYVREGAARRVRARYVVLACWNSVTPYLCPEMPEDQRKALSYAVKVPLTYTNVCIKGLDVVPEARDRLRFLSGKLLRERVPRLPGESRLLSMSSISGGADGPPPHASFRKPGVASERTIPGGALRAPVDHLRDLREKCSRPAGTDSRGGRIRPGTRHRGHYREPLAPRIRVRVRVPRRARLDRERQAVHPWAEAFRPHLDRELRCGRRGLPRLRHRPGISCRQGDRGTPIEDHEQRLASHRVFEAESEARRIAPFEDDLLRPDARILPADEEAHFPVEKRGQARLPCDGANTAAVVVM